MKLKILLSVIIASSLMACTIQKRHHLPGYSIQLNKKYKSSTTKSNKKNENHIKLVVENECDLKNTPVNEWEKDSELVTATLIKNPDAVIVSSSKEKTTFRQSTTNKRKTEIEASNFKTKDIKTKEHAVSITPLKDNQEKSDQSALYLIALLMGLTTAGIVLGKGKSINSITRWAKNNPKKAQVLIASIQSLLMAGGVVSGYNLKMLGFEFSDASIYIFGGLAALSFASLPFLPKKEKFVLQEKINIKRIAVMGVIVSSIMLMAGFGNRFNEAHPESFISNTIEHIDHSIFSDNDLGQSPSINLNVQSDNENNKRKGAIAGFIILGVFLMIILIAATCAGICIAALGSSIPIAFFGILVATGAIVASVFIMTAIARKIHRLKAG